MDLSKYDSAMELLENGVPYHLQDPATGEDTDVKFYIGSFESKRVNKAKREFTDAVSFDNFNITEEKEKLTIRIITSAIVSWENVELDGKNLECTEENKVILLDRFPFIAKQIENIASDRSRFFFK